LGIPAEKIGDFERSSTFGNDGSDRQICDFNSKFRTFDGTCNNVGVPAFGKSGTIFNRLVFNPSEGYDDGESNEYLMHLFYILSVDYLVHNGLLSVIVETNYI
jgi:hypothetical protein